MIKYRGRARYELSTDQWSEAPHVA